MSIRTICLALGLTTTALLTGCHRPHGAVLSYTGGSYTYYSYETLPKSIRIVDQRTNETVFAMDIPVGKQLTIKFQEGEGDDPVYTPDVMHYEVMDMGTTTGKLRSMMSVPSAASRKIEVDLRQGPEYVAASPERMLRTDQVAERPDWWSPRGGEMPEDKRGVMIYDR